LRIWTHRLRRARRPGTARAERVVTRGENAILAVASRWMTPLAALFAFMQLASWPAGAGVGFVAGVALAVPIAFNALLFGVQSVLVAMPAAALRAMLALGLIAA